jgi:hypothetical protein
MTESCLSSWRDKTDKNFPISKPPADNLSGSSLSEPEPSSRARKNKKKRNAKKAKKAKKAKGE